MTIIVLAFNEDGNVASFLGECLAYLDTLPGDHEVVCVDDGSTDRTRRRALEVQARDPRVRVLWHDRNRGIGAGFKTALGAASGDYFAAFAADGQVSPYQLDKVLPLLDRVPIITTVYSRRPSQLYRTIVSFGLRSLMWLLLGLSFRLEGIYLFPVALARDEIGLHTVESDTFFFSFELICRAVGAGHALATTVIDPRPREDGASKVANFTSIYRVARDLVDFKIRLLRGR